MWKEEEGEGKGRRRWRRRKKSSCHVFSQIMWSLPVD
jgi:hypothetical protein